MLFYEEFIKKIRKDLEVSGKEKFSLELKRTVMWLGTGIPFLIAGLLQIYIYLSSKDIKDIVVGFIFLFLSFKHIKLFLSYGIVLDFDRDMLKSKDVELKFENIESCELREEVVGKRGKVQPVLDIITFDRRKIIIPLMMTKQVRFVSLVASRLKARFIIK
ncbi:hypothetical protein [Fusobacterium perfoetens]|uniref:hypothetical protein n=1 Tax=Fusobacterium perfoetens TaxID=852 RepID=UPI000482D79B|nr:hypothetical protein [Fusobacterium perfoetens]MCI6152086.1 hypothetical protein [Fusobacterium perfoetens]MDY3238023.1 hypothetical protein [Fusobacterium perfoetens]